jgi:hypothetical protein
VRQYLGPLCFKFFLLIFEQVFVALIERYETEISRLHLHEPHSHQVNCWHCRQFRLLLLLAPQLITEVTPQLHSLSFRH